MQQLDLFVHAKVNACPGTAVRLADGRTVSYTLKRSARAKNVWLRIGIGTGLEVVAPEKMPLRELGGVLEKKSSWIQRHLSRLEKTGVRSRRVLKDGSALPYMGEERPLRVLVSRGMLTAVRLINGEIVAAVPEDDQELLVSALMDWYRKMARKVIVDKVGRLANGHKVGRIMIKDQKTRWGSCSSKGNLNFNWRLIMAPPKVIDYLVVHELTHLEHPNHSKRFWNKVAKRFPDYAESEAWLKEHGRGLTLV